MGWEQDIKESIQKIAAGLIQATFERCTVKDVDKSKNTITATSEESELDYFNVLLGANIGELGIVAYPVVGSKVIIGKIGESDTAAFVAEFTEIEEYLITLKNGFKLHLKADGTALINGDQYGGLVISGNVADRLNAIEDKVLALIVDVAALASPLGLSLNMTSVQQPILTKTDKSNLENSKVKHG